MTWPRGFAVAESAWSPREKKNWPDFVKRVEAQFERMDVADTKYARCMYDVIFKPTLDDNDRLLIELDTELDRLDIYYTFEGANPDHHYPRYEKPLNLPLNAYEIRVITYRDGKPIGKQINMPIEELQKRAKK
jgi:hexosaminidase